jgi:hypothetical protein
MDPTNLKEAVEYWNYVLAHDYKMGNKPQPQELNVEQCIKIRALGYEPGKTVSFYGFTAEIISYPYPSEKYGASINVREPGNPDTVVEAAMNPSVFKHLKDNEADANSRTH